MSIVINLSDDFFQSVDKDNKNIRYYQIIEETLDIVNR
jgi:hypothetical protein